jgi:hypothetical protein
LNWRLRKLINPASLFAAPRLALLVQDARPVEDVARLAQNVVPLAQSKPQQAQR